MWLLLFQDRGAAFLASLAVGGILGLIYDFFRLIRVVYVGGRIKLFFEDVLFCIMSALVFTVFIFNATMGVVRMFAAVGALVGFFSYRFSIGLFTVPAARKLKGWLTPPIKKACLAFSCAVAVRRARHATERDIRYIRRFASNGFE